MQDVFHSGEVIEFGNGKSMQRFRVYTRHLNNVVLFPMPVDSSKTAVHGFEFRGYTVESLRHGFLTGSIRIVADAFMPAPAPTLAEESDEPSEPTLEDKEVARRLEAVEFVLLPGNSEHALEMISKAYRAERLFEATRKFNMPRKLLRRLVSRYLTYGMTAAAFRKFTWKMGSSDKKRKQSTVKLGRRCRFYERGRRSGCNVTPEIRSALCPFTYKFFAKAERKGQKAIRRDAFKAFIQEKYGVGRSGVLKDPSKVMSFSNFKSIWHRLRHPVAASIAQNGNRHHRDHREKVGTETGEGLHAGFCYQADFTVVDMELVHPIFRQERRLGKPFGGLVGDVFSSSCLGLNLTFNPLSGREGLRLLQSAFSDKTALLKSHGLDPDKYPIPGGFLPTEIVVDNGELRGKIKRIIPVRLKVRFTNNPPYRPDLKGTIESMIGRLFGHKIHLLDGFNPHGRKRGDRYPMDGVLDLGALRKIILMAMGMCNRQLIKEHYRNMSAIRGKVPARPIELWRDSIEDSFGILRRTPPEEILAFLTLPCSQAMIDGDGKGVVFEGHYYFNQQLFENGAIVRARKGGGRSLSIVYDPDLVDVIYLVCDANRWLIQPLFLSDRSAFLRHRRMSFADAKGILEEKDFHRFSSEFPDLLTEIDYDGKVEDIFADQRSRNKFVEKKPVHSLTSVSKKEARRQYSRDEKRKNSRVLTNPGSEKSKTFRMPGAVKAAPPKSVTAAQRAVKQLYKL